MSKFKIPKNDSKSYYEVSKSKFISYVFNIEKSTDVKKKLIQLKQEHPKARHFCYAYQIGEPQNNPELGFSDDGEPNGTAGRPILNVVSNCNIGNILCVVVRYFGGTKLGTGGLVKAYTNSASQAISNVELVDYQEFQEEVIECRFEEENTFRKNFKENNISILKCEYGVGDGVKFTILKEID